MFAVFMMLQPGFAGGFVGTLVTHKRNSFMPTFHVNVENSLSRKYVSRQLFGVLKHFCIARFTLS